VGRQTIAAAVDLRDRQRNALARRRRQLALVQRAQEVDVTFKSGWAIGDKAEQVRHDAELLLNRLEQGLGRGRRGFDGGRDRNAGMANSLLEFGRGGAGDHP
jgi:hypothetical protein